MYCETLGGKGWYMGGGVVYGGEGGRGGMSVALRYYISEDHMIQPILFRSQVLIGNALMEVMGWGVLWDIGGDGVVYGGGRKGWYVCCTSLLYFWRPQDRTFSFPAIRTQESKACVMFWRYHCSVCDGTHNILVSDFLEFFLTFKANVGHYPEILCTHYIVISMWK